MSRSSGSRAEARVGPETLRKWLVQAHVDDGDRAGPPSEELAEIKALESQVRDLTEANEILKAASIFFARGTRPPTPLICCFIVEQRTLRDSLSFLTARKRQRTQDAAARPAGCVSVGGPHLGRLGQSYLHLGVIGEECQC